MESFEYFIVEQKNDKNVSKLKSHIVKKLKVKLTSASRGAYHIRFPLDKQGGELNSYLKKFDLIIEDYGASISSKFETYYIVTTKDIPGIPKGTRIPWVNNHIGSAKSGFQLFNNKDLNPDNLGLAGSMYNKSELIKQVSSVLQSKYDKEVYNQLITLLKISETKKNEIKIPVDIDFSKKDLAKVSADFGEIMSAVWAITNFRFTSAFFPLVSNEKLIDFYGVRLGIKYPISVKSGGGGKVTIQNIITAIKNRAKTANINHDEEKSLAIFRIVNDYPMREQMILLHIFMKTPAIKKLAAIMKVDFESMTLSSVKSFIENKTNEELIELLKPFWKILNTNLTDRILYGDDKLRLIISPLGENIWKILNDDKEIKESLTSIARQVMLKQVNVDVNKRSIKFASNRFKDAIFSFGWAGYTAGNKLGFKMVLK